MGEIIDLSLRQGSSLSRRETSTMAGEEHAWRQTLTGHCSWVRSTLVVVPVVVVSKTDGPLEGSAGAVPGDEELAWR